MGTAVVAGVDAPPVLEFAEHFFDFVPLAVKQPVMRYLDFPIGFLWDTGLDLAICKGVSQPVCIVALVGQERLGRGQTCQQGRHPGDVTDLACGQKQAARAVFAVADSVQFRIQPTFGASDILGKSPFLSKLAAVRCAFR